MDGQIKIVPKEAKWRKLLSKELGVENEEDEQDEDDDDTCREELLLVHLENHLLECTRCSINGRVRLDKLQRVSGRHLDG